MVKSERVATYWTSISLVVPISFSSNWTSVSSKNVQIKESVNLKFIVKLGKTDTEAYSGLREVCESECLMRKKVFELYKRFKEI